MSLRQHLSPQQSATPSRSITRTSVVAGVLLMIIGALHLVVMAAHPYWRDWLQRGLWSAETSPEASFTGFWAMPGSFALPLVLLGYVVVRLARAGAPVPSVIGWGTLAWAIFCVYLIGPSGFILILLPSLLLVVADLARRRQVADKRWV